MTVFAARGTWNWLGLAAGVALVVGVVMVGSGAPARGAAAPGPVPMYARYLPPGKYTAIVVTSNATKRRWILSLKTRKGTFPITIGGATNVVIPFENGWDVLASDEARLESPYVPFEDLSKRDLLDGNENLAISAWGITDRGPVEFAAPLPAQNPNP
jgi:hypothetical protein